MAWRNASALEICGLSTAPYLVMLKTGPEEAVRVFLSVAQLMRREPRNRSEMMRFSMVGSIYMRRSVDQHAGAGFRREIGGVDHVDAFHGEVDAGARFVAFVDRADEIRDLLGESTEPIFIATRAIPAGLCLEFFREVLAVKDGGIGRVGFDGVVGGHVGLDHAVGHEGGDTRVQAAEADVADDHGGARTILKSNDEVGPILHVDGIGANPLVRAGVAGAGGGGAVNQVGGVREHGDGSNALAETRLTFPLFQMEAGAHRM